MAPQQQFCISINFSDSARISSVCRSSAASPQRSATASFVISAHAQEQLVAVAASPSARSHLGEIVLNNLKERRQLQRRYSSGRICNDSNDGAAISVSDDGAASAAAVFSDRLQTSGRACSSTVSSPQRQQHHLRRSMSICYSATATACRQHHLQRQQLIIVSDTDSAACFIHT